MIDAFMGAVIYTFFFFFVAVRGLRVSNPIEQTSTITVWTILLLIRLCVDVAVSALSLRFIVISKCS